ncbi:MAG: hypothetical protein DI547_07205 [Sphingobium sp.]|jgi:hypothetical protein|nr:MAG: hypothetical protein DI547_07205 [Sphingobium sp.]
MDDSNIWSVDTLAARNLLAHLNLEASPEALELVGRHLAAHRQNSMGWAAERARSVLGRVLDANPPEHLAHDNEDWLRGYHYAGQQVLTIQPDELLSLGPKRKQSKGQILRGMVRQARKSEALRLQAR